MNGTSGVVSGVKVEGVYLTGWVKEKVRVKPRLPSPLFMGSGI